MNDTAKLKLDELNMAEDLKLIDPKDIIDAIAQEAERIWGKDWFAELVRQYCEIEGRMTGETPPARMRRSTIDRALRTGKTTLETVTWLAACVNAELQLAIHRIEIRKF